MIERLLENQIAIATAINTLTQAILHGHYDMAQAALSDIDECVAAYRDMAGGQS